MKIAFVGVPSPGHLNPMASLARQMKLRGHDVLFLSLMDTEAVAVAAELPFAPLCPEAYPAGGFLKFIEPLGRLQGEEALEYTFQLLADISRNEFVGLPKVLAQHKVDAVLLDEVNNPLGLVPMSLGMPYATVSNALPFDFTGLTPVCTFSASHDPSSEGLVRNRQFLQRMKPIFAPREAVGREYAQRMGLDIDWDDPFATISKRLWLAQTPKVFDLDASPWPSQFHYTGPFHDGAGRGSVGFPWEQLTGDPLIYASLGTLQNGLAEMFNTIAKGVGERSGMQLVLSVGPVLDVREIKSLPKNAVIVNSAPQLELLKQTTLCITHGGLNTALECLSQGVPMVVVPITNDQPGVAARIAATGTGTFIPLKELTASSLRAHVDEVLGNPKYRSNALRLKKNIQMTQGLTKAADLLEEAFGLRST
ncbi:nucleotide disphospho-sugar-binding domain-containing protein [Granulicella sp. dw_53]|uniref:glycosyltransferase n=1 Tax=Granulicella sp. dw_53 TaxID=2719792 RepID=UPI001BD442A2|nr:nucleotide disphospho-sugar-binding domain-containing protein [Granulicella sp. dw_53]